MTLFELLEYLIELYVEFGDVPLDDFRVIFSVEVDLPHELGQPA